MIVAFIHTMGPCTSTTGNSMITGDFQFSAWFAGLHLAISSVLVDQDLTCWLCPWYSFASPHTDGTLGSVGSGQIGVKGLVQNLYQVYAGNVLPSPNPNQRDVISNHVSYGEYIFC